MIKLHRELESHEPLQQGDEFQTTRGDWIDVGLMRRQDPGYKYRRRIQPVVVCDGELHAVVRTDIINYTQDRQVLLLDNGAWVDEEDVIELDATL